MPGFALHCHDGVHDTLVLATARPHIINVDIAERREKRLGTLSHSGNTTSSHTPSPFDLAQDTLYRQWREHKLADYPQDSEAMCVEIANGAKLSQAEHHAMLALCRKTNMVIYRTKPDHPTDKATARALGHRFGLQRLDPNLLADEDGITSLQVVQRKSQRGYIPYSNKRLLWHTDGYYNPPARRIRAMLMHTVQPAVQGGDNQFLDPEIVYLLMRDTEPAYVRALMQPDAMTIPANTEAEGVQRPAQGGPVFFVDPDDGCLHMRYTARTRSIEWKPDSATAEAVAWLEQLLASESPYILRYRFAPGEGVLCNNVLHNRSSFEDSGLQRLVYRARYYDRIANTAVHA